MSRKTALGIWRELGLRTREGDNLPWLWRLSYFAGQRKAAHEYADAADATPSDALDVLGTVHLAGR